jgi:hypothetical protein
MSVRAADAQSAILSSCRCERLTLKVRCRIPVGAMLEAGWCVPASAVSAMVSETCQRSTRFHFVIWDSRDAHSHRQGFRGAPTNIRDRTDNSQCDRTGAYRCDSVWRLSVLSPLFIPVIWDFELLSKPSRLRMLPIVHPQCSPTSRLKCKCSASDLRCMLDKEATLLIAVA